jgi:hypothetical protein
MGSPGTFRATPRCGRGGLESRATISAIAVALHRIHIHLRGSCTIHNCNANGVRHSFGRSLGLEKKGPQCEIVNRRMGYCMKRIEVDLKCMQLEIGTKKLECKEEKEREICRR